MSPEEKDGEQQQQQQQQQENEKSNKSMLDLPANATAIRENISDGFSCKNKSNGYYADPQNDCQIFHVCHNVDYGMTRRGRKMMVYRWSFICPEETVFDQNQYTCVRKTESSIECPESPQYYPEPSSQEEAEQDMNSNNMEKSTKSSIDRTTSKSLIAPQFPYSASGVSQKLLQKIPALLVQQAIDGLNDETRLNENKPDPVIELDLQNDDESIGIDRVAKQQLGRKTFLFKADADAAKNEQLTER
uniref:CSON001644 protein n=1 Tax=Culicoides sonorensis TaxID=179676 RepID=A0A336MUW2_CULSO